MSNRSFTAVNNDRTGTSRFLGAHVSMMEQSISVAMSVTLLIR